MLFIKGLMLNFIFAAITWVNLFDFLVTILFFYPSASSVLNTIVWRMPPTRAAADLRVCENMG